MQIWTKKLAIRDTRLKNHYAWEKIKNINIINTKEEPKLKAKKDWGDFVKMEIFQWDKKSYIASF